MKCPNCGHTESKVIDSRPTENSSIRRRRECLECGKRFTTYEIIDTIPIFIVKKDGSREIYDRNKMMAGMVKACYKRNNVTKEMLDNAADEIEAEMQNSLRSDTTSPVCPTWFCGNTGLWQGYALRKRRKSFCLRNAYTL